jgi:tetratricopeptide (TPR) repeat protein
MARGGLRGNRAALVVAGVALVVAAPGVLAAAKVTSPWALGGATAAAAVVAALGAVTQDRYLRHAQRRDERKFTLQDGCLVLPGGDLPRVRDITDPVRIGVHKAAPATGPATAEGAPSTAGHAPAHAPAYVPRDVDGELRERLRTGGFVLLTGDSTAGKSRAAFEAMTAMLPDHLLLWPAGRDAVAAAFARAAETRRCVLWLDDLEGYLGNGGVTATQIDRLLIGGDHHRVVLATLRTAERQRLLADEAGTSAEAREALREIRLVLGQPHEIRVPRMFSKPELARARGLAADPRIAEALAHADAYGVPEYMAAGPELFSAWEDARDSSDGQHARGAALVTAAIDIRRAGHLTPIPRALLDQVHELYLAGPGRGRIQGEPLPDAWAWATRRRRATTALLQSDEDDRVEVFDYLVDKVQRRTQPGDYVPEPVVIAAIDAADPADEDSLADTAYYQGRYALAEHGWEIALRHKTSSPAFGPEHPSTLSNRGDRALMLYRLGRLEEAEAEQRALIAAQQRILGPEHENTLVSRGNLANTLHDLGRTEESATELRAVLSAQERVLGPEHRVTLINRGNLASALLDLGRTAEAEAEQRAVQEIAERVLGAEDGVTLSARENRALALRDLGRTAEAETELRAATEIRTRTLGPEDPRTLVPRANLAGVILELGRDAEAEAEFRALVEIVARVFGSEYHATLAIRSYLARALAGNGQPEQAEAEYRAVLPLQERTLGPDHPDTVTTRGNLAALLRERA